MFSAGNHSHLLAGVSRAFTSHTVTHKVMRVVRRALTARRCYQQWEAEYDSILHEHNPAHMEALLEALIPLLEQAIRETRDPHVAELYQRVCSFYAHLFGEELPDLEEYDPEGAADLI